MDKISVIIPVYNVEPYIRKCIDSVINQTYINLEIILVDDGSTDNSGKVCDEYATKDKRVKVLHKRNGGVSSAKNAGLKEVTGKYLGFVDSDDWIEPEMYEILYNDLTFNNASFSTVNFFREYGSHTEIMAAKEKIEVGVLSQEQILLYEFRIIKYAGFSRYLCNKLFRSETALKQLFDENIRIGEDNIFLVRYSLTPNCTSVYNNKPMYHYLYRESSLVNSLPSIEAKIRRDTAYRKILISLLTESGYSDIAEYPKRDYCYIMSQHAENALESKQSDIFNTAKNEMLIYLKEYLEFNRDFPERIERINKLIERKL